MSVDAKISKFPSHFTDDRFALETALLWVSLLISSPTTSIYYIYCCGVCVFNSNSHRMVIMVGSAYDVLCVLSFCWPPLLSPDWTEAYIICFFAAPVRIAITTLANEFRASKDLEILTICTLFYSGQQTGKHIFRLLTYGDVLVLIWLVGLIFWCLSRLRRHLFEPT